MKKKEIRFSPLAELQLDAIWDYGLQHFGAQQADYYLDGLFSALEELAVDGRYKGLQPRRVPVDAIADITALPVFYIHYGRHYVYLRDFSDDAIGIVCILGDRMDTPARLRENLLSSRS